MNIWEGWFGKRYHKRNKNYPWQLRENFWKEFIKKYKITSALELGAGMGFNLACIENYTYAWGVECNMWAVKHKICESLIIWSDVYAYLDYYKNYPPYDLVFTCGFLCHQTLRNTLEILDKMDNIVGKYLLLLEYGNFAEESYWYHGKKDAFFKRPYFIIMESFFRQYKLVDAFKLIKQQGFDDLDGYLFIRKDKDVNGNNTSKNES